MTVRLDPVAAAPDLMKTWLSASRTINSDLEPRLAELVKIRASQIYGCASCINMHTVHARADGETVDDCRHQRVEPDHGWFRWLRRSGGCQGEAGRRVISIVRACCTPHAESPGLARYRAVAANALDQDEPCSPRSISGVESRRAPFSASKADAPPERCRRPARDRSLKL